MSGFNDQYTELESAFVHAFCHSSTSCQVECNCGRVYFTSAPGHGDYSEGELEGLQKLGADNPKMYFETSEYDSIDIIYHNGKSFVPQCECGFVTKCIERLESDLENMTSYCAERLEQKRRDSQAELDRVRREQARFKLKRLPVGTRIRFINEITAPATEDHPPLLFASKDGFGAVIGHCNHEGHLVKADAGNPGFGAAYGTEFVELTLESK